MYFLNNSIPFFRLTQLSRLFRLRVMHVVPAFIFLRRFAHVFSLLGCSLRLPSRLTRSDIKIRDRQVFSRLRAGDKLDLTYIEVVAVKGREAAATTE